MTNKTANKFPPEIRERSVRMVLDHEDAIPLSSLSSRS
jgi:hypothetical protein